MELNKIYNQDCIEFMRTCDAHTADIVLTSPPYNTDRSDGKCDKYTARYGGEYQDTLSNEQYIDWTIRLFEGFDRMLKPNGVVLYNISYSSDNRGVSELLWTLIADIIKRTKFTTADCIVWKKKSALANNTSSRHLTRICEFVFVFCRKEEYDTFQTNKGMTTTNAKGQKYYENIFNFIEAPNNDENCPIHKATYSSLLCRKLLEIYASRGGQTKPLIYDPFMGTGTTAIACIREGLDWIGTELSTKFTEYANKRIEIETSQGLLF